MKQLLWVFVIIIFSACNKSKWDTSRTYTVEGYVLFHSTDGDIPLVNKKVAVSQENEVYKIEDASAITDSNGYFKISYTATGKDTHIGIYPSPNKYNCIYGDISYINGLNKGEDVNVGKLYIAR